MSNVRLPTDLVTLNVAKVSEQWDNDARERSRNQLMRLRADHDAFLASEIRFQWDDVDVRQYSGRSMILTWPERFQRNESR